MAGKSKTFTFDRLPTNVGDLKAAQAGMESSPFATAALAVAAFCRFEASQADCFAMIDALRGPAPMSEPDRRFVIDRLRGKEYTPRSFFAGATPGNGYEPTNPYTITVSDNSYSYTQEGYATLYITSGGADSPRPVKLRTKPSTGEWFLWGPPNFLSSIRVPASDDPWA